MKTKKHITKKYINMLPKYPTEKVFEFENIQSKPIHYKIPTFRPVRIYCDGVYDLFHYGHANSLAQAKNLFPNVHLIVGVTSDAMTHSIKGITVFNEDERAESLRHCRYVDEVITEAPWILTEDWLDQHKIDYVAQNEAPYKFGDIEDIYKSIKDKGRFVPIKRTMGISTSGIITKIVKDYDIYVLRNLERGASAQELGISIFHQNRIKVSNRVNKFVNKFIRDVGIQRKINEIKMELKIANMFWERVSNDFINSFLEKFNRRRPRNVLEKIVDYMKSL
ncbi:Choline-phosphate cytidylyltransferase B [Nosema granulosis]|uniref:choline-phosphate cytidylyltransferase n=1 Tax=Nosema granulosis TaxID=83296 RepID=A0A9P6GZN5_9MICR|nr:Choline-phosphate cytidylyltransferase B [Nosema granulosis]